MSTNNTDFRRPPGIDSGVLLNTNNEALLSYKKAKRRMAKVDELEEKVNELTYLVQQLLDQRS